MGCCWGPDIQKDKTQSKNSSPQKRTQSPIDKRLYKADYTDSINPHEVIVQKGNNAKPSIRTIKTLDQATIDKIEKALKKQNNPNSEKISEMSCGHFFQKKTLREAISSQLQKGSTTVRCPLTIDQIKCNHEWSQAQWTKVGEYSKQEREDIEVMLSINLATQIKGNPPSSSKQRKPSRDSQKKIKPDKKTKECLLQIKVKLINNSEVSLKVDKKQTVEVLKQAIYKNYYEQLDPGQTILQLNCSVLEPTKTIGDLDLKQNVSLVQRKAEIWQIPLIKADKNKQDEVSCQIGIAIMSCGHNFGRQSMRYLIKAQLSSLQSSIKCPYKTAEGQPCNKEWNKKQWTLVAGYTHTELIEVNEKLSLNWLIQNTKKCPYCSYNISISGLKTRRVVCPLCHSPDFCFTCLSPWQGSSSICNSDVCKTLREKITNSPWEREFTLKHPNGKAEVVKTPVARACPRCRNIIQNVKGCKHTKCPCVTTEFCFCFVCLGLFENEKWPCGSFNTHCGYVAPNQKFD